MEAIRCDGVSKRYGSLTVLDQVSLSVERGTICGLVGRNGSGKTQLIKALCGFIPVEGDIWVNGHQVTGSRYVDPSVGVIVETPGFLSHYSGLKNLRLLASINGKTARSQLEEAMVKVGLDPHSRQPVRKYSLGMRQRLAIAQAFGEGQQVLILDEPMNGLDRGGVEAMRALFCSMKSDGRSILLASHSSEDIRLLCDKVYEMESGRLCLVQ